jgi:hypothetical protein
MNYDAVDFKTGLVISLLSKGRRFSKRGAVAYLYGHVVKDGETPMYIINGAKYVGAKTNPLPDEIAECKYIFMVEYETTYMPYTVYASNTEMYLGAGTDYYLGMVYAQEKICNYKNGTWSTVYEDGGQGMSVTGRIVWSNFNLKQNDVVICTASDPIPIYE